MGSWYLLNHSSKAWSLELHSLRKRMRILAGCHYILHALKLILFMAAIQLQCHEYLCFLMLRTLDV
ncbi:unnamed protein product [Prunus armeniaca]